MTKTIVLSALCALSHERRHDAFMLLVRNEPFGLNEDQIAEGMRLDKQRIQSDLELLEKSRLIRRETDGDQISFRADLELYQSLTEFLRRPLTV